mgnify:CR=1 FL=1
MAARKKIGVLTFHRCINYGSYWQARCLVEGLRNAGHDAELLDHDCPEINYREWRCSLQPTLPEPTPSAHRTLYKEKGRRFFEAFDRLPMSRRFSLYDPSPLDDYDTVVVGSDEVWNLWHPWYGQKHLFYGDGLKADRLVSYAASFGNYDAEQGLDDYWGGRIRGFHAVSVRDQNSLTLVSEHVGVEPELVLDPCLQFPEVIRGTAAKDQEPYALIYGHGFPEWLGPALKRWSANTGVRLVSVGYGCAFADESRISAGPLEFAGLVAGAQAVVTNFFHGCVFALLNGKPFVSVPTPYRFNKVRDLTAKLGAERHLLWEEPEPGRLAELLGGPPQQGVADRINDYRARSAGFLHAALA